MPSVCLVFTVLTGMLIGVSASPPGNRDEREDYYEPPHQGRDRVGRDYSVSDGCPIVDTTVGLTGTEYYKAVVEADGRNSVGFALTAKYHHGHHGSQSLGHMKAFAEAASIFVGIAFGLRDNSSPEQCLINAKALLAVNGESINHRTDIIRGGYGLTLRGEEELQCQVKRRGQALCVAGQVGGDHVNDAYQNDFYLGLLVSLAKDVTVLSGITAANQVTYECNKAALDLGHTIREIFRTVHSDRVIRDAFGLDGYQRY